MQSQIDQVHGSSSLKFRLKNVQNSLRSFALAFGRNISTRGKTLLASAGTRWKNEYRCCSFVFAGSLKYHWPRLWVKWKIDDNVVSYLPKQILARTRRSFNCKYKFKGSKFNLISDSVYEILA